MMNILQLEVIRTALLRGACGECRWSGLVSLLRSKQYERVRGLRRDVSPQGRVSLHFGTSKINPHQAGAEFAFHAARPTPGSADLCFLTDAPIAEAAAHVRAQGVAIIEGPVARIGAQGPMTSIYFRDPDGNLVEIARYGGWRKKRTPEEESLSGVLWCSRSFRRAICSTRDGRRRPCRCA